MSERRAVYTTAAPVVFAAGTTARACQPPPTNDVTIVDDWLLVGGVKVARVGPGVVAFHDRDRRREAERGTDQVLVQATDLIEVLQAIVVGP